MNNQQCRGRHAHGRGPTSYRMHDSDLVFRILAPARGSAFLDLGCGPGDYSIHAARLVGTRGTVYSVDIDKRMADEVGRQAEEHGLNNIRPMNRNMTDALPLEDDSVDTCLLSTSLHCLDLERQGPSLFRELHRILRTDGIMAVLECKKEKMDFGPPLHMRISAKDIAALIEGNGYQQVNYADLGVNYLACFRKTDMLDTPLNHNIKKEKP
ncbi:class I SAM-dependent methyltransferase [Salidesulfovibrio onnuriiensis]|uniref:class I SAM-dependent methyltransferase n=1 Tax=Salidesulfovibrio onnuriiensis TaxID=2583823 RepID=UPI0011C748D1|nr:class I SAM-dependent methyltransferase [Salidesulfovibrio onnuriiensis]